MGECFAQNEASLSLRAIVGVHDQQHPIDHAEGAFHFTTEVSVTGCIENIDDLATPMDGGVFGLDGYAFFFLQIHRVHGAFSDLLIFAIDAALFEQLVY